MTRATFEALALEARADIQQDPGAFRRWAPVLLHAARCVDLSDNAVAGLLGMSKQSLWKRCQPIQDALPPTLADALPRVQEALGLPPLRAPPPAAAYVGASLLLRLGHQGDPSAPVDAVAST